MPRKLNTTGYRLVYEPADWSRDLEQVRRDCETAKDQFERHVDHNKGRDYLEVEPLTEPVCSFCGYDWTEAKDSPHNGGCCADDADLMPDEE